MTTARGEGYEHGLVDAWFLDSLDDVDPESIWRARLILVAWALVSALTLFSIALQSIRGSPVNAVIGAVLLLMLLAVPALLRRTASISIAAHSLAGGLFCGLTVVNVGSAGNTPAAEIVLVLVPVLAFLAPGRTWPCIWALLVCIEILAIPHLETLGLVDMIGPDPSVSAQAIHRVPVLLVIFVLIGGLAADRISREGHRRKQLAQQRLDELNLENTKLSEAMLERQKNLAAVGTLAAGMAHQINNPVGSILIAAQYGRMTLEDDDHGAATSEALASIENEARRCGQIVHSLLKIAGGERGEKWKEDIHSIVQAAVDAVLPYAKEYSTDLHIEKIRDAPLRLLVSPIELEQAIVNLIRNGIEACGSNPRVTVRTIVEIGRVRITVEDNGRGLSEEEAERIFETFYTTRQEHGGSGLGLGLVKRIVEDHGGHVCTHRSVGHPGTIFEIQLPLETTHTNTP